MLTLMGRIEKLERRLGRKVRDRCAGVVELALRRLSDEDLDLVEMNSQRRQNGLDPTPVQVAAQDRYESGLTEECRRAGFRSLAEFLEADRRYQSERSSPYGPR